MKLWAVLVPLLLVMLPLLAIGVAGRLRLRLRPERQRSPLTGRLHHQPGEQLRRRISELDERINDQLLMAALFPVLLFGAWAVMRVDWQAVRLGAGELVMLLAVVIATVVFYLRIVRTAKQRRRAREGLAGEMAVAQALTPLLAEGCMVLHDIPGERGNIDHVVIGPTAVFAIETKSRRKPLKGRDSARVQYDGKRLLFPQHQEVDPLAQVKAVASWLRQQLAGATGENLPVLPVLMLPGWYVERTSKDAEAEVFVRNEKMSRFMLEPRGLPPISEAQRRRIVHALVQRYPEHVQAGAPA